MPEVSIDNRLKLLLVEFFAAYPASKPSRETILVYVKDLSGVPIEVLTEVLPVLRRSQEFIPSVALILKECSIEIDRRKRAATEAEEREARKRKEDDVMMPPEIKEQLDRILSARRVKDAPITNE